jgi:hypothetical protein
MAKWELSQDFQNTNQTNQITFFGLKLMEYIHLLKHPTDFNRLAIHHLSKPPGAASPYQPHSAPQP